MSTGVLRALTAFAIVVAPASAIHFLGRSQANVASFSFSDFVQEFNRSYAPGSEEWARREAIYDERKRELVAFLNGPPRSWSEGITEFIDYTGAERQAMLGYKGLGTRRGARLSTQALEFDAKVWSHPSSYAAVNGTALSKKVHSQGGCGSCWAHAAMSTLEGQLEAKGLRLQADQELSVPTTTYCTPNPRHCGGSGGCGGATVELAYEMIKQKGAPLHSDAHGVECKDNARYPAAVTIDDYVTLPVNKLHPLMQALYDTGGPVAVSVDAGGWFGYLGGIFSDTAKGRSGWWTVNHAVTLVAYNMPDRTQGGGYWLIKNSWGSGWGEDGHIRLEMKEDEESHCGMDRATHEGLACDGDPDEAWVCGTCGVLYDSAYPVGVKLA